MGLKEALVVLAAVGAVLGLLEWRFATLENRLNDRMSLYLHQQLVLENRIGALEHK